MQNLVIVGRKQIEVRSGNALPDFKSLSKIMVRPIIGRVAFDDSTWHLEAQLELEIGCDKWFINQINEKHCKHIKTNKSAGKNTAPNPGQHDKGQIEIPSLRMTAFTDTKQNKQRA